MAGSGFFVAASHPLPRRPVQRLSNIANHRWPTAAKPILPSARILDEGGLMLGISGG